MTCNFRVGQKVVKFRGSPRVSFTGAVSIDVGTVLTIRAVQTLKRNDGNVRTGLIFEEVRNEVYETNIGPVEPDYKWENFRPVVERKSDISIFKAMLNPKKEQVRA